jgi:hypothetical protein
MGMGSVVGGAILMICEFDGIFIMGGCIEDEFEDDDEDD